MKTKTMAVAAAAGLTLCLMAGCAGGGDTANNANATSNTAAAMNSCTAGANTNVGSSANASNASGSASATVPSSIDVDTAKAAELLPYVPDGAYRGTAEGYNSYLTVRVTVQNHALTSIEVISQDETPMYYREAEGFLDDIVAANSTDIDVTSTASVTCRGFEAAVDDAMRGAVS